MYVLQTRHFESPYLVYHEKIKTSRVFIRDCSMVSVYPLILLGGGQVHMQLQKGEFVISLDDGWIRFVAASHQVRKRRDNPGSPALAFRMQEIMRFLSLTLASVLLCVRWLSW